MRIDRPAFRHLAYGFTVVVAVGAVYLVGAGRLVDAAILAGFVFTSLALAVWHDKVPSLFTLLITVAAAINAAGYIFDLWEEPVWFDEAVHVITPFALIGAAAWVMIQRDLADPRGNGAVYFAKVLVLGLLVGFAWEGFEYVAGIIGDKRDTVFDLLADAAGALAAAAFCLWAARNEPGAAGSRAGGP